MNRAVWVMLGTSVVAGLASVACGADSAPDAPSSATETETTTGGASGTETSTYTTTTGLGGQTVLPAGGTGGLVVDEGIGLTSPVFGSLTDIVGTDGEPIVEPCDYGDTPTCDYTRMDTCCAHLACDKATNNPDDPYPIQSCEDLLTCVQANPGCNSAADPLCFGDEDPNAPCLDEGYLASHTDPEGPFQHTLKLMNCLCGYPQPSEG